MSDANADRTPDLQMNAISSSFSISRLRISFTKFLFKDPSLSFMDTKYVLRPI